MWDAEHYLQFDNERTRPTLDLASHVDIENPETVLDIGCGPGNSTQVLRFRWPNARIIGLDNSLEMITAAREKYIDNEWVLADISQWSSSTQFDVIFSNAALQWIGEHDRLMSRLFAQVALEGALAFQIPSNRYAAVRRQIHEIAEDPAWCDRMEVPKTALTMEEPSFYYDILATYARKIDIWETEYYQVLESPMSIVDWISSTGLRPFLEVLNDDSERNRFIKMLNLRVEESYPLRSDDKVLFPFKRLFVVAYK